jgi:hypothetical protein
MSNTCSCCGLEKSNLQAYPDLGVILCPYCEMLPASELTRKLQQPDSDTLYTVLPRLLNRLELRLLREDPELPIRTPIHDKALTLVLELANSTLCPGCRNINTCTCIPATGKDEKELPAFWPYTVAREIKEAVEQFASTKPT